MGWDIVPVNHTEKFLMPWDDQVVCRIVMNHIRLPHEPVCLGDSHHSSIGHVILAMGGDGVAGPEHRAGILGDVFLPPPGPGTMAATRREPS